MNALSLVVCHYVVFVIYSCASYVISFPYVLNCSSWGMISIHRKDKQRDEMMLNKFFRSDINMLMDYTL